MMAARAPVSSGVTAESLYRDVVWPALWKVLQLTSPPPTPANASAGASSGAAEHVRCSRCLQRAVTHALVQLLRTACVESVASSMSGVPLAVMQEVVSHLLLHPHGTEQVTTSQVVLESQKGVLDSATASPAAASAAVEVERLYLLVCAAIQLSAQMDVTRMAAAKIAPTAGTGAASAMAAPQLPWGVAQASKSVVAGIFALSSFLNSSPALPALRIASHATPSVLGPPPAPMTAAASPQQLQQQQLNVQHLWFTFLFVYLQQLSSQMPKDTTAYGRFLAHCGDESRKRLAITPVLSDSDDDVDTAGAIMRQSTAASEIAALQAWAHVPADLLRDAIGRTRFRRAALLFKSCVPHMLTQAPTVTFLLVDVLREFARSWTAFTQRIPAGCMADDVTHRLARYDTRSVVHDVSPTSPSQEWQQCVDLFRAYGDRLTLLLGTGTPHGHLVATTLCTVLSALYVMPYTRVCAPKPNTGEVGSAAAGARGKRDEDAAVLEMEAAHRQPRRTLILSVTGSAKTPPGVGESLMSEAEWRLRHYVPFGQLLAYAGILELQKVHLFAVTTAQLRVGRSVTQQVDHTRMLALAALYCGVAGWDLTVLMYHFAECPLNPFGGPETLPPALPTSALARYTASVQQYVEHTRAELIMEMPFTELRAHDGNDGGSGRVGGSRHRGMRRGRGVYGQEQQQSGSLPCSSSSAIPSRGELHTRRFMRIVHPDPVLLNWRLHLTATEALVATTAAPNGNSAAAVGGGSSNTTAPAPVGAVPSSLITSPSTVAASSTNSASGNASTGSGVSDVLLSPCCLIRDIVISGQYALAADGMQHLAEPPAPRVAGTEDVKTGARSVNVLLLPRRAYPQQISVTYYLSILLRRWLQRWEVADQQQQTDQADTAAVMPLRDEAFGVLSSFVPILSVAQSYMANQSLLVRILARLSRICRVTVAAAVSEAATLAPGVATAFSNGGVAPPSPNAVFALAERLLIAFVMPCVRVLPPAPMVYDAMEDVLQLFARFSAPDAQTHTVVPYGEDAAMPLHMFDWLQQLLPSVTFVAAYRTKQQLLQMEAAQRWPRSPLVHPHDALLRKEREALLSQSLKRLNAENLNEYRALLRPILYAEPLLVAHRLFIQAVGYSNSFLDIHTRLLRGLPAAVLMLVVQQGLVLMARYAAEEKFTGANGENRVAILATFLATLWRDNLEAVDGTLLVRRVELALRSNSGDNILLGTELCKALLAVMAHRTLEHEEKYNPAQLQALAYTPTTTSLFGRGTMTSFRVRYWKDTSSSTQLLLSPVDVFVGSQQALLAALQQPCLVPVQGDAEGADKEEEEHRKQAAAAAAAVPSEHRFTLGQQTLLHLCRLQSCIYELQRDLDGGAELILLSSAERYNTINDMLLVLEEMSPPPTECAVLERLCACVQQVALPHVASLVETQQRRKFEWASGSASSGGAVPSDAAYRVPVPVSLRVAMTTVDTPALPPIAQLLQYFTAAHFDYKPDPYDASRYEWQQCMERARSLSGQGRKGSRSADTASERRAVSIVMWLNAEAKRIDAEESMHKHLHSSSAAARAALLELIQHEIASPSGLLPSEADDRLMELAVSYLLPRAVLNLREAATVAAFFTWLFQEATSTVAPEAAVRHDDSERVRWSLHCRAIDLALTFVTAAFTFFVGLTDGECKRLGCVLQRLLQIPSLSAHQQQLDAAARLSPLLLECIQALSPRARPGSDAAAAAGGGARVLDDWNVHATATGAPGKSAVGGAGAATQGDRAAVNSGGLHTVSCSAFDRFLSSAHDGLDNSHGASSRECTGPASLLSLAMARGLVSSSAQPNESPSAAAAADNAAAGALPAVPLQLESHLCRAIIQLLTHEQDVPSYAHRNLFLVLEQLDKSAFPATLCAVDLLTLAVEPHASKAKSYYALASAVLKLLRMNRRHHRELQHVIASLRHGEEGVSPTALQAARGEKDGRAVLQMRAAAAAFHGQWRLSEHYMRQLLQNEVAVLLKDPQVRHRVDHDSDEDEESEEGRRNSEAEKDAADGASRSSDDGEGDNEGGMGDDLSVAASAQDNGEEEEENNDSGRDEDASSSGSESDDEEHDDGSDQDEYADSGDGEDASPAPRKRRLEQ